MQKILYLYVTHYLKFSPSASLKLKTIYEHYLMQGFAVKTYKVFRLELTQPLTQ